MYDSVQLDTPHARMFDGMQLDILHACMFDGMQLDTPHACSSGGGQKKALDCLQLELQMVVTHHMVLATEPSNPED